MNIELRKLADIRLYENNPRANDAAVEAVAASIREFGFRQPIVVDADGVIIVGHTRWKAAQKAALQGLYPPTKIAPTTPDGQHAYPGPGGSPLSRRQRLVRLVAAEARNEKDELRLVEHATPNCLYRLAPVARKWVHFRFEVPHQPRQLRGKIRPSDRRRADSKPVPATTGAPEKNPANFWSDLSPSDVRLQFFPWRGPSIRCPA